MKWTIPISVLLLLAFAPAAGADDNAARNDQLWKSANEAYGNGNMEAGHAGLRELIESNPGDVDLAVKCLERIREAAGRSDTNNRWVKYAVHRLSALERIGALSANSSLARQAMDTRTNVLIQEGRRFEVVEETERWAKDNPHDVFWKILRAQSLRKLDSIKTQPLYQQLKTAMDLDHPDLGVRQRWHLIAKELQSNLEGLPKPLEPVPDGSPLPLMELDDPDGRWQTVADRSPKDIPVRVDRLASQAMLDDQLMLWRDMSGLTDPVRALDLHLLSKPASDVAALRKIQAEAFAQENISAAAGEAEILALFRRYPWALPAQKRLFAQANKALLAGHSQSALRSFQDLLDHVDDAALKDEVQVGYWAALAQIREPQQFKQLISQVDPNKTFTWMGQPATAAKISDHLLARRSSQPETVATSALKDLRQHVVRVPPVSPWPAETPSSSASVDMRVEENGLLVSGRNLLAMYDAEKPGEPVWTHLQRHPAEQQKPGGYHPGYIRPTIDGPVLFSRWGFTSVPTSIAAFDRSTGRPLWSNEPPRDANRRRVFNVPMGDPVVSDGLLYYLQWNTLDNVNQSRGRRLSLVCFDPRRQEENWKSTISEAGGASDALATFERAAPQSAIYGNRVTIHDGAVYSNSNAGLVARSDVRDGRTAWIHYYRRGGSSDQHLGAVPIVAGNQLICMPRDAGGRVFALDQRTGRLVWDNTQMLAVELVGTLDDTLIVRGQTTIAALDMTTGEARWYLPITSPVLGRTQLIGGSIYLAQASRLQRLDARTGRVKEVRPWDLDDERPQSFTIHGGNLYVVTDKPADDAGYKLGDPLNAEAPQGVPLALPLKQVWSLPRSSPLLSLPPARSPLSGRGYLLSGGILECIDISTQGAIRWRRFFKSRGATIHFVDEKLLIVARGSSRIPGMSSRLIAFDGQQGRTLWDTPLADELNQLLICDSMLIFYSNRGRMLAIDSTNGRRAWERDLQGNLMTVSWDGTTVHGMYVPQWKYARHLTLDPASGQTLNEGTVETKTELGHRHNGKRLKDGYYEVKFDPIEARYIRLVALSEINFGRWTSIAELQIVGTDGANVSRKNWRTVKVDSVETQSNYNTTPEAAYDGNPVTWWHTKWIGGIPPHPHEIQIDLGSKQTIKGMRYLPAVIINNNGMIRDYELYASNDTNNWGDPVAKGVLVNRVRIERPLLADNGVFFEAYNRQKNTRELFRYNLDGKPADMISENGRLETAKGPYVIMSLRRDNKDVLTVLRGDDPSYRYELTADYPLHREGPIQIEGDRLILGRRSLVAADLAKRQYIIPPTKDDQKQNRSGLILREGADNLLKIVHLGNQGQAVFRYDLRTGAQEEYVLADQLEQFQDRRPGSQHGTIPHFDGVLLLTDNSTVTAWTARGSE